MISSDMPWYRKLHVQILAAMLLGGALGIGFGAPAASAVGWLGDVFIQALRMVIVPLVFTSLTHGVASIGTGRELGRIGFKTLAYYVTTSLAAILVGLTLVNLIQPGVGADLTGVGSGSVPRLQSPDSAGGFALRLLLDFIPQNPVAAMTNAHMLGIIGFSILLGVAIAHTPQDIRDRSRRGFDTAFHVMMVLTGFVIKLVPIGVLGLVTRAAAESGAGAFLTLGKYMLTILLGLLIHALVTLPVLLLVLGRIDPRRHYRNVAEALVTAFSTSSSSATLPVTLRVVRQRVGASDGITSFVIPMGSTVNMDGTALYECVGAVFIAQVLGMSLGFGQQVTIVVTALAASIGAAGIPSAGLVMIFIVLEAIGLTGPEPYMIVGAMLAIDRPLDMLRTATNVLSDTCGAAIIARSEGEGGVDTA